jgi:hypothetical protein
VQLLLAQVVELAQVVALVWELEQVVVLVLVPVQHKQQQSISPKSTLL